MEATAEKDTVTISTLWIKHRDKYAVMISHRDQHSVLPWEYDTMEEADADAKNLMVGLIANGFTEGSPDTQATFDFPDTMYDQLSGRDTLKGGEGQ